MPAMSYVLGAWGKREDGSCSAPVYESGTNACVYWVEVVPHQLESVQLWKVVVVRSDSVREQVMTALKDTVGKARAHAEKWVREVAA